MQVVSDRLNLSVEFCSPSNMVFFVKKNDI
jgi:hypothetical protein